MSKTYTKYVTLKVQCSYNLKSFLRYKVRSVNYFCTKKLYLNKTGLHIIHCFSEFKIFFIVNLKYSRIEFCFAHQHQNSLMSAFNRKAFIIKTVPIIQSHIWIQNCCQHAMPQITPAQTMAYVDQISMLVFCYDVGSKTGLSYAFQQYRVSLSSSLFRFVSLT